jgi:hypothetical protein
MSMNYFQILSFNFSACPGNSATYKLAVMFIIIGIVIVARLQIHNSGVFICFEPSQVCSYSQDE